MHPAEIQGELIKKMTPCQRLEIANDLYVTAWELKKAGLKRQHPDWSDVAIEKRTRWIFLTGYAGD